MVATIEPTAHEFDDLHWRSEWIWADGAPGGRHVVLLSTTFEVEDVPATLPARWCAVSRAVVSVNGVEVGRGPVRANPRRQPYELVDIAPHLRPGENVVTALVVSYGSATPWYLPLPPISSTLAGGAFVFEAAGADGWLVTDETWFGTVLDGWGSTPGGGISGRGIEQLDARSLPVDGRAAAPVIVRDAAGVGEPGRSTPPSYPLGPFGARPVSPVEPVPVAFTDAGSGDWTTDRIVFGSLVLEVEGPAGAGVTARVAESTDADGRPSPNEHDAAVRVVCDGTRRQIESIDLYGGQGVRLDTEDGVTVHGVTIRERVYPVTGAHRFSCSDPVLDDIWAVGRRSVSLNSYDAYTDCPTREQRAWTGDFVVHQMVDLTTNDDWLLARRNSALIAESRRSDGMLPMAVAGDAEEVDFTIIPDWALHWVHAVWNEFRYVGDRSTVAAHLTVVEGVLRWFDPFIDAAGLLRNVFGWVIVDWSSVHTEGASSALNGLYGRALLEFAEMSRWVGDEHRAAWATNRHATLAAAFEAFWDPARRRYVDSLVGADATTPGERCTASEHGQAAALVGGVVPQERVGRLVDVLQADEGRVYATFSAPDGPAEPNSGVEVGGAYLRGGHPEPWWDIDGLVVAQPFFSYVVHDALVAAGRADLVEERCRRWSVALERCPTSWTETWFGGTISHGWSSTPTRDLVQRVLGVTPAEPGFVSADIAPHLGSLSWAEGTVPTPHGTIAIRVERSDDGVLRLDVDSPVPFVHDGERHTAGRHRIRAR